MGENAIRKPDPIWHFWFLCDFNGNPLAGCEQRNELPGLHLTIKYTYAENRLKSKSRDEDQLYI